MTDELHDWEQKSKDSQKAFKYYLQKTNKNVILPQLPDLTEQAFEKIDCLKCANCCRNYSPRFKGPDIKRISRVMNMKETQFIDTYLRMDDDGDYVTRSKPCPFLGEDNFCSVYEDRPSDCVRFPYTDEDIIFKKVEITLKNSSFCPIVYYVLDKLRKA
ncbi:MAG: YkgJ family cysteine cluster protein [Chitinophagaceae bacterium]